ncbi:S1C family serine protease [Azohydromonas caseinilytica]|uniref:PDZ domain-containing protein n=1 Tax=Azohydromonas caseinilytica TaxID=2728836 RepID=A0A848FE25_9BURK|nr:trypsin-like peptidase domain-containing protein [Azohydromonas caseinilytica]NML17552.1 PDZ domain-containing protein [Azohydromonas caseinilytica]
MRRTWLIFSQAVTVAVALLFVVSTLKPEWLRRGSAQVLPEVVAIASAPPPAPGTSAPAGGGYSAAARAAAPTVASVVARKAAVRNNPHGEDPWFRFFFRDGEGPAQPQKGLGSAVIVSSSGYLLTNNHVIEDADEIEVQLADGRQARARLVGSDPETDVAVLKIDLERLPAITFGATEGLQVGDVVLAIGNPFGVGQTVTSGIVSALGRNQLGINTFENFIQTDAAINPGNSGGALVDTRGQLVGINTAIFSRSGGSLGIGFAIPADTARQVMESLIRDGQVTRGWIGVEPQNLTPEFIQSFKLPVREGVLISGVLQNGPAGKAGMRPGDVVTRVGERPVANTAQLLGAVAALKPRSDAVIGVQRGDQALDIKLTVGQRPKPGQREQ